MLTKIDEEHFFSQKVSLRRKFSNFDLRLLTYFARITGVFPENIISLGAFTFFFVAPRHYLEVKGFLKDLRRKLKSRKILILRTEQKLLNLIFSFFPDLYIHDLHVNHEKDSSRCVITVSLLTFAERGIALGRKGKYIKTVNKLLEEYLTFEEYATFRRYDLPIRVKCEVHGSSSDSAPLPRDFFQADQVGDRISDHAHGRGKYQQE